MDIFLISPVADKDPAKQNRVEVYVRRVEKAGHKVHWPIRDTKQEDPLGGYQICVDNFAEIIKADRIRIWYDETSGGSKFDMGGLFMYSIMLGHKKKVKIINKKSVVDPKQKSFFKVFCEVEKRTN